MKTLSFRSLIVMNVICSVLLFIAPMVIESYSPAFAEYVYFHNLADGIMLVVLSIIFQLWFTLWLLAHTKHD